MVKEEKLGEMAKALRAYVEEFDKHKELLDKYMGKNLEKTWIITEESIRELTEADASVEEKREKWVTLLKDKRG